ncbi:response regulator [Microbacterium sp. RD1]|uniref:response regulator n=1 Tax=Microbacterium sp. RD1 TaxID=3457313 RepID=UPI003FA55FF8
MAIARLSGGPLDGQVVPLDDDTDDTLIVPYGEGQLVYRRQGVLEHTGEGDGPSQATFVFGEETEDINPDAEGRLD